MMQPLTCLRCHKVWTPKRPNPARCPQCKSTRWNVPDGVRYRCSLCGYEADTKQAVSSHIRFTNDDGGMEKGVIRPIIHGPYGVTPEGAKIIEVRA